MVRGFTINENGNRVPCNYGSDQERAWCECQDLLKAKLYKEAYHKLDEYHDINGGFVNKNDWMMILKVEVGYLHVKPTKPNFDHTKQSWAKALCSDTNDSSEMVEVATQIIDIFAKKHKIPLEYDDFEKVDVKGTAKILDFMRFFIEMGNAYEFYDLEEYDFLHIYAMGIRNLREKGDEKKACKFFKPVEKLSCYGSFFAKDFNPFHDD